MGEKDDDYLYRFLFEDFGVRGEFVRLGATWRAIRERRDYPPRVAGALGRAVAAVTLLSATIKFRGALVLQLQGDGLVRSLVAQASDRRTVRGIARYDAGAPPDAPLFGQARLVLSAESPSGERYQGIVPVEGEDVAAGLAQYFERSEQLPTRLWLAADAGHAAGLFLQRMPGDAGDEENWSRVTALAETVSESELLTLDVETLLHRLFHEETLRLFEPEPVAFRCGCSREKVGEMLAAMGEGEVTQMLDETGTIEVQCEFCGQAYRFDAVDAARLFRPAGSEPPERLQ